MSSNLPTFPKLQALKCYSEAEKKIRAGVPCENVAVWIQEDQKEYLDVKLESLIRILYRFKAAIPFDELTIPEPLYLTKRIEHLKRGINEADEIEKLYLAQLSRLSMAVALEEKIKIPNSRLWKDVEIAKDLLLSLIDAKVKLGIYKAAPIHVQHGGTVGHAHAAVNPDLLAGLTPERRQKLGAVAQLVLQKTLQTVEAQEEGTEIPTGDYEVLKAGESSISTTPDITTEGL